MWAGTSDKSVVNVVELPHNCVARSDLHANQDLKIL